MSSMNSNMIKKCKKSSKFVLNSLKDDKSVLQEDLMSRKTNEERTNLESELQEILQPEFIKQIGLTKNGEIIQPEQLLNQTRV